MTSTVDDSARRTVPVAVYVVIEQGRDPESLLEICRAYAREHGWRVASEEFDTLLPDGTVPARRPGWSRTRGQVVEGWAHGLLTYAPPMFATGSDRYTDVELWAEHRRCFLAAAWQPGQGELVLDTASGRIGVFMARVGRAGVMLRPEGGGREWPTPLTALVPARFPAEAAL